MKRKRLYLFIIVLLLLGVIIILLPQREYSAMEKRELATNEDITLDFNFHNSVESVLKDQFPYRDKLVKYYYEIKTLLGSPFNSENHGDISLTYLADDVIGINDDYYINSILSYDDEMLSLASSRGFNVNEFDKKYPNVKTYVYFPTRLEELLNDNYYFIPKCQDNFIHQLNENINYSSLAVNGLEDHQNYFYKTDAHWNNKGAYQGYKDIIEMISQDYPSIGTSNEIDHEVLYNYEWHGNITSQIGQIGSTDVIKDYVLANIGEYDFYINGEEAEYGTSKADYAANGNNTQYSDYDLYFGDNYYLREFDFHNEEKPNILIFADSYINTNQEWIASNFNKTLIIDLRARPDDFSLDKIIDDYDIDIALITYPFKDMYENGNMFIPLD